MLPEVKCQFLVKRLVNLNEVRAAAGHLAQNVAIFSARASKLISAWKSDVTQGICYQEYKFFLLNI
jgi:hypothetical protein